MTPSIRIAVLVFALGAIHSPLLAQQRPEADARCNVTAPNGVMAGVIGRQDESYGNALLSVGPFGLWPNGTVIFKPGGAGFVTPDGAFGMKFGWMRGARGTLAVVGRRLDGAAAPLRFETNDGYDDIGFQASYLIFPMPGCWEVTAQLGEREDSGITFITKVVKVGEGPSWRRPSPREAPATEQFAGSTPCDALPRRLLGIANDQACERITWRLALSTYRDTGHPATYELLAFYGIQAQSAPGFVGGGTPVQLQGRWSVVKGTRTNPDAVIYRIRAEGPARSAGFAKIGDNLLHLLNDDDGLMIGNPGWSYTLNRIGATSSGGVSRRFEADVSAHTNPAGVFEGRSPCQELARQLNVGTSSECTKIKWRLTLLQDPATGAPTTYKLEGFVYRNPPRTGKWTIVKDPSTNAVVYRLDPDERDGLLSLFKADDNILLFLNKAGDFLVGDLHYSYTLNRVGGGS